MSMLLNINNFQILLFVLIKKIGLGKGNAGVPPPPWAYVPLGYGKPQFCFLQPAKGDCEFNLTR